MSIVRDAFGVHHKVTLESGREFKVPKWGVRKMLDLSETIASIVQDLFGLIDTKEEMSMGEVVGLVPELMKSSAEDFARVVESSLTLKAGRKQITLAQIMGDDEDDDENLMWDEFVELSLAIINVNMSPKTLGKLKALALEGPLGRLQSPKESTP